MLGEGQRTGEARRYQVQNVKLIVPQAVFSLGEFENEVVVEL